jgi:hypothetical protein
MPAARCPSWLRLSWAYHPGVGSAAATAEIFWAAQFDGSSAGCAVTDPVSGQRRIDYTDPEQDVFLIHRSDPRGIGSPFNLAPLTVARIRRHPFTIEFELSVRRRPATR